MDSIKAIFKKAKKPLLVFRAINHPVRQKILQHLEQNPGTNVTTLYKDLKLAQAIASQQLAILRNAELVTCQRVGSRSYYSVNKKRLEVVENIADQLA